jgi:FixJ family two-component response regulator
MHLLGGTSPKVAATAEEAMAPRIYVVDDDPSVRIAIMRLLKAEKYAVAGFDSAEAFLEEYESRAGGCIILDNCMPGLSGVALQQHLAGQGDVLPIIFVTACADVRTSVHAMKCGASDFLTKPIDARTLLAAVARALEANEAARRFREERLTTELRLSTLTNREREVLTHVLAGRLNKQIAGDLGIKEQTIKVHRARMMDKMRVRSIAELARLIERTHSRSFDPCSSAPWRPG